MSLNRMQVFADLYTRIHDCRVCIGADGCKMVLDPKRVPREVIERSLDSRIFIVGQALGPSTQRLSGVPFVLETGKLSSTGKTLDKFLQLVGYTIDPRESLRYAYYSDTVQRYPGSQDRGDREPTAAEIINCSPWLEEELRLISPDIIITLGEVAARSFLKRYAGKRPREVIMGNEYPLEINGKKGTAFPVPHPVRRRWKSAQVDDLYATVAMRINDILGS